MQLSKIAVRVSGNGLVNRNQPDSIELESRVDNSEDAESVVRELLRQAVAIVDSDDAQSPRATQPSGQQPPRLATEKQCRAIEAMAKRQGFDLRRHLHDDCGVSGVTALTISEASNLIDQLKGTTREAS